jgi:hypothetical protein
MLCDVRNTQVPKFTFSRIKGNTNNGGGSGWSPEGKTTFDTLYNTVKEDRIKHAQYNVNESANAITFNKELLKLYQRRRESEAAALHPGKQKNPQKRQSYQCIDEFDDASDTDDEHEYDDTTEMDSQQFAV